MMSRGRQPSRVWIEVEGADRVAVLVGYEEHHSHDINREVARPAASGCFMTDVREPAGLCIEGKDDEAIVPAIRAVEKATIRRDMNVGTEVLSRKARWQGRYAHVKIPRPDSAEHFEGKPQWVKNQRES